MSSLAAATFRHLLAAAGAALALTLSAAPCLAVPFAYHDYAGVVAELEALAAAYPELVELDTAQELYGLPTVSDGDDELPVYILRITNESLGFDKPELLLVGVQHGNEVVSVEVALALARLLLESHGSDPWLTALVDRREIYLLPLANPWGFRNDTRTGPGSEGFEDMNRDHVYDRDDCLFGCFDEVSLSTVGARAIHELGRRHLFRVMLDYHGGVEIIIHPWGTPLHLGNPISPDHSGHDLLGIRMQQYGGPYSGFYPVGTSNDLLGAVHGPLDDTAYAATWDAANADPVWPTAGAGALSYTIEISEDKRPPESTLGGDADLLTPGGVEDGYVPKHVRVGLAAIDIVEPWIEWTNRDQVPTRVLAGDGIDLEWQVRGCFQVDDTHARFGADPDPVAAPDGATSAQSQTTGSPCFDGPTLFGAQVVLPAAGAWYVAPVARVDSALLAQSGENPPGTAPQSWLVRARNEVGLVAINDTDPAEVNSVQGRLWWGGEPLLVEALAPEIFADDFESGSLSAWSAAVGMVDVTAAAAAGGLLGLAASLDGSCALPADLIVDTPATVMGTFEACSSVRMVGVEVTGATQVRAGWAISLREGFGATAPLTATLDESLNPFAWLTDDRPYQESSYSAAFQLNLDPITMADGDRLVLLEGSDGAVQLELYLLRDGVAMEHRLGLVARLDSGARVETTAAEEVAVPAGWHGVEVDWLAGAGTGHLLLSLDGGPAFGLTGLDNELGRIDQVRWGAVGGAVSGTTGSLWLDDFDSGRRPAPTG